MKVIERNGWRLYTHPLLRTQLDKLDRSVERARLADPATWRQKPDARLLASIRELMFERIPRNPLDPIFRQGNTLGPDSRHWFRAKFGGNRFRLFFRADSQAKVIVYAWVNDRDTLRKAGATTDPYAIFANMLKRGNPPSDWTALMEAATVIDEGGGG